MHYSVQKCQDGGASPGRADGLARKTIFEAARSGVGIDQRRLVEHLAIPLAVVNGLQDPFIRLDYFEVPNYTNLWEGRCHRLPGLKHAPFWEAPDVFDGCLQGSLTMSPRDDLRR